MSAKKKATPKRKRGRPSKRTPAVEKRIIEGLMEGTPLTVICKPALRIADTPLDGMETVMGPDGEKITRKDMLGHRRLQVDTRLKLLAKWDPKRYGERMTQEISGPGGAPIQTQTLSKEQDAALDDLVARVQTKVKKS